MKSFIPKGYGLLDSASGDLNKDGIKDLILILKNNLEESFPDTTRPLLILHGTKTKGYVLVAKNAHVVLCKNCGGIYGDPYERVVVKNNFFSVEHYGGSNWRWTRIITFKYDMISRQYVLHRDAGISFHTSNPDKTINMTTGDKNFDKLPFVKFTNQE
ncbi:MAG: hypothetical protein HY062_06200 [Bacteroidetes bacterium]|nr:hypothetical protein [Bacteroidota bacterium]